LLVKPQLAKGDQIIAIPPLVLIRPERLASCFPTSSAQNAEDMGHPVLILLGRINKKASTTSQKRIVWNLSKAESVIEGLDLQPVH
jgi:hypothetical protein